MDFKIKVVYSDVDNAPPYVDKPVAGAEVTLGTVGSAVTGKNGVATIPAGTLTKIAAPIIVEMGERVIAGTAGKVTAGEEFVVEMVGKPPTARRQPTKPEPAPEPEAEPEAESEPEVEPTTE